MAFQNSYTRNLFPPWMEETKITLTVSFLTTVKYLHAHTRVLRALASAALRADGFWFSYTHFQELSCPHHKTQETSQASVVMPTSERLPLSCLLLRQLFPLLLPVPGMLSAFKIKAIILSK